MSIHIDIQLKELYGAIGKLQAYETQKLQGVKDAINEAAVNIQFDAKSNVSVDTGNLRSRIIIEPVTGEDYALRVGTYVKYGFYVEFGTGIHGEDPPNGAVPRRSTPWAFPVSATSGKKDYNFKQIEIDGESYYVTRGSKPHPFLLPAYEKEKPNLVKMLKDVLGNA